MESYDVERAAEEREDDRRAAGAGRDVPDPKPPTESDAAAERARHQHFVKRSPPTQEQRRIGLAGINAARANLSNRRTAGDTHGQHHENDSREGSAPKEPEGPLTLGLVPGS